MKIIKNILQGIGAILLAIGQVIKNVFSKIKKWLLDVLAPLIQVLKKVFAPFLAFCAKIWY